MKALVYNAGVLGAAFEALALLGWRRLWHISTAATGFGLISTNAAC